MPNVLWNYRESLRPDPGLPDLQAPIVGFGVEASDGSIGTIDEATHELDASYVVVDTGPWIFGQKVMLPAGLIERIDFERERVFIGLDRSQVKQAPDFTETDEPHRGALRQDLSAYYHQFGVF